MPTVSPEQRAFFHLCKENPGKATKKCPPRRVIDEFLEADNRVRQQAIASGGKD
jgi:hypothetical protein